MITNFWKVLRSGTDIRGIASEGVEGEQVNLTDDVIERITMGFLHFLLKSGSKKPGDLTVSVGHDSRISSDRIKHVVISRLIDSGVNVIDVGLSSTPAMFMTTVNLNCDAAIEITASHHPFNRNGLKFFKKYVGGLQKSDIDFILDAAQEKKFLKASERGNYQKIDYMAKYCSFLREKIKEEVNSENYDCPLSGLKIVVDAGNGVGGFYALSVLAPLGADVSGSQFLDPDGMFPNHIPNPEDKDAINCLKQKVIAEQADLGIIFDTDVDRCGAVDRSGMEINRNKLIALASAIALEDHKGGVIVTDSITSDGLSVFINKRLKGVHHRFKRGYKNVINEAIRISSMGKDVPLAIETSGHAAFKENYFLDDGAYLVTKIVIKLANLKKTGVLDIGSLISQLKEPKETIEKRIKILDSGFKNYGEGILSDLKQYIDSKEDLKIDLKNCEGVKVRSEKYKGWFLIRLSLHDPVLPVNVESNRAGGAQNLLNELLEFLKSYGGLSF